VKEIIMAEKETETVEVMIPREAGNKEANFFVGVNGVNYILPRGKKSKVPPEVAAEIERGLAAQEAMYDEQAALQALAK
jgi:hypothetical protein